MNEAEWLACTEPDALLRYLEGKVGDRKMRLLACAFCRQIWDSIQDEACHAAVEVAERFADKQTTKRAFAAARKAARAVVMSLEIYWQQRAANACLNAVEERPMYAYGAAINASGAIICNGETVDQCSSDTRDKFDAVRTAQCCLIRDVIGNPFRPVTLVATWQTPTAVRIAQNAYEQRLLPSGHLDPACLAVLSDALEDAGCTDATLLGHLREPGPHVRGCWALDLLLGKE